MMEKDKDNFKVFFLNNKHDRINNKMKFDIDLLKACLYFLIHDKNERYVNYQFDNLPYINLIITKK